MRWLEGYVDSRLESLLFPTPLF